MTRRRDKEIVSPLNGNARSLSNVWRKNIHEIRPCESIYYFIKKAKRKCWRECPLLKEMPVIKLLWWIEYNVYCYLSKLVKYIKKLDILSWFVLPICREPWVDLPLPTSLLLFMRPYPLYQRYPTDLLYQIYLTARWLSMWSGRSIFRWIPIYIWPADWLSAWPEEFWDVYTCWCIIVHVTWRLHYPFNDIMTT